MCVYCTVWVLKALSNGWWCPIAIDQRAHYSIPSNQNPTALNRPDSPVTSDWAVCLDDGDDFDSDGSERMRVSMSIKRHQSFRYQNRTILWSRYCTVSSSSFSCRKSTVGKELAERLKVDFLDGDDLHSSQNISKMKSGSPLGDEVCLS